MHQLHPPARGFSSLPHVADLYVLIDKMGDACGNPLLLSSGARSTRRDAHRHRAILQSSSNVILQTLALTVHQWQCMVRCLAHKTLLVHHNNTWSTSQWSKPPITLRDSIHKLMVVPQEPSVCSDSRAQQSKFVPRGGGQQRPGRPLQPACTEHSALYAQIMSLPSGCEGSGAAQCPSGHTHWPLSHVALPSGLHPKMWHVAPVSLPHTRSSCSSGMVETDSVAQQSSLTPFGCGQQNPESSWHFECAEHSAPYEQSLSLPSDGNKGSGTVQCPSGHRHCLPLTMVSSHVALLLASQPKTKQVAPVSFPQACATRIRLKRSRNVMRYIFVCQLRRDPAGASPA